MKKFRGDNVDKLRYHMDQADNYTKLGLDARDQRKADKYHSKAQKHNLLACLYDRNLYYRTYVPLMKRREGSK